jgi:hypothetical protein
MQRYQVIETDALGGFKIIRIGDDKSRYEKLHQIINELYPGPGVNDELEMCTRIKKEEIVTAEVLHTAKNKSEELVTDEGSVDMVEHINTQIEEDITSKQSDGELLEAGVKSESSNVVEILYDLTLPDTSEDGESDKGIVRMDTGT